MNITELRTNARAVGVRNVNRYTKAELEALVADALVDASNTKSDLEASGSDAGCQAPSSVPFIDASYLAHVLSSIRAEGKSREQFAKSVARKLNKAHVPPQAPFLRYNTTKSVLALMMGEAPAQECTQ